MLRRNMSTDPHAPAAATPFAESTPLGLLGLAIGCAALIPVALGKAITPDAFRTAAWFCLLFGAGCQFLAGILALANKNGLGGTLFLTFSFNWVMNWWSLSGIAEGRVPNHSVVFAVDVCFLIIFVVLSIAFAYASKLLFAFLADIILLYVFRIGKALLPPADGAIFNMPIVLATVALAGIALYLAFALLLNPAAGRVLLPIPGPLFTPKAPQQ
jgi:succinate-acetate transporter protein